MNNENFLDKDGLMYPWGENSILFTSEYILLKKLKGRLPNSDLNMAKKAMKKYEKDDGSFKFDEKEGWSHDNHTGLVCLSVNIDSNYHRRFFYPDSLSRMHPRDLVFYAMCKGGIVGFLARFLSFIPSIAMIVSCYQLYKYRTINGVNLKILKTDGKILTWLRVNTLSMPLTKIICNYIIKKRIGSWQKVFEIYFGKDHPNTILAKGL